jgi:hypothetical protein
VPHPERIPANVFASYCRRDCARRVVEDLIRSGSGGNAAGPCRTRRLPADNLDKRRASRRKSRTTSIFRHRPLGPRNGRRRNASSPARHPRTRAECGRAPRRPPERTVATRVKTSSTLRMPGTRRSHPDLALESRSPFLETRPASPVRLDVEPPLAQKAKRFPALSEARTRDSAANDVLSRRSAPFWDTATGEPRSGAGSAPAVEAYGRQDQGDAAEG